MRGPDNTNQRVTTLRAGVGDATGRRRQRLISATVPERVAEQVLCELACGFTRTGTGLRRPRSSQPTATTSHDRPVVAIDATRPMAAGADRQSPSTRYAIPI